MEVKKQTVTPKIAQSILDANNKNRRIRQRLVKQYATEMLEGRWREDTGEMIKIAKSGNVLDGQHRLLAVIAAQVPIKFHIASDIEDDRFEVLDSGLPRAAVDAFGIEQIAYANVIPSMIMTSLYLKENKPGSMKEGKLSTIFLLQQYHKQEKYWQSVASKSITWYQAFSKILPPSLIGGLYTLFYSANESEAENFMSQLCIGLQISNETVALLRQKLINDKLSIKRLPRTYKIALVIKTWNSFLTGEVLKVLKYEAEREQYPTPLVKKNKVVIEQQRAVAFAPAAHNRF